MLKTSRLAATLALLMCAAPLLSACHTTAGAGQDISAGGNDITHAAKAATP